MIDFLSCRNPEGSAEVGGVLLTVDHGGPIVSADLDALLTCVYALVDDLLPARWRFGRPPRISDSALISVWRSRRVTITAGFERPMRRMTSGTSTPRINPALTSSPHRSPSVRAMSGWVDFLLSGVGLI